MEHKFGDEPAEPLDLQRDVEVVRRRYFVFLIPFFLGWLLVWSISWVLPARYKWGTQIRVPITATSSNLNNDLPGRLQKISQSIRQ